MILHILFVLLFMVISCLCIYTDLKKNIVPNKYMLIGAGLALILQVLYVGYFGADSLSRIYFMQLIFSGLTAVLFYAFKVWAGGDTKLYILMAVMMPINFYAQSFWNSALSIVVAAYAIAFIYIVAESIVLTVKKEPVLVPGQKIKWKDFVINWLFYFSIITIIQRVLHICFGIYYSDHYAYFVFLNVFLILLFIRVNVKLTLKIVVGIILLMISAAMHFFLRESVHVYLSDIFLVTIIYFLRIWGNRFNYKKICVDEVQPGMIPSAITVIKFAKSKVKGLPANMAEDMSARITQEEADSIKRWAKTKNGESSIWIVRKIPFALFICISYGLFLLRGIYGQIL